MVTSHVSLQHLFDYDDWANREVWKAVDAEGLQSTRSGEILSHILETEYLWYARIEGHYDHIQSVWTKRCLEHPDAHIDDLRRKWSDLLHKITPTELKKKMRYRNTKGIEFENSIQQMLVHVIHHGTYHRGQIAQEMRNAGKEPASTDYIGWLR